MANNSSRTAFNIAFCGIVSAISVIVMYLSLIPAFAYAVPAIAGMFIWTVGEQTERKWAYLSYLTVSLLSFILVPELEADFFLLFFFGYYPTLRHTLDKIKNKVLRYMARLGIFNIAVIIVYNILVIMLSAEEMLEGLEDFGQYAVLVFWAAGNVAFVLYDLCLDTIKMAYIKLLKPKLSIKLK